MKRRMGDWAKGRYEARNAEPDRGVSPSFFLHLLPLLMGIRFSREDAIGWLNLAEIACELHWRRRFDDRISRVDSPLLPRSHPSDVLPGVFSALFSAVTEKRRRREIICTYDSPRLEDPALCDPASEEFEPAPAVRRLSKDYKRGFDVSKLMAMDGRLVELEMWFRQIFDRRIAIAKVAKPRSGEPVPTVTFVLWKPGSIFEGATFEVQVPDEQLGDFEEVRKGLYRLKSVLYLEEVISEI